MENILRKKQGIIDFLKTKDDDPAIIENVYSAIFGTASPSTSRAKSKYRITANQKTFLKAQPIQASSLPAEQKKECDAGTDLELDELEIVKNAHLKIKRVNHDIYEYLFKPHWDLPDHEKVAIKQSANSDIAKVFKPEVPHLKISQPDSSTCQSACIAMAIDSTDVYGIHQELERRGIPGDPLVMSWYLNKKLGDRHIFDDHVSVSEMRQWLRNGEFLITYGWFTKSGHVICLDGVSIDQSTMGYKLDVSDPWSEFDFISWSYNKPSIKFFDGFYSSLGIYAACVAGTSSSSAQEIYSQGQYDNNRKGAWVHRILPEKK